VLTMTKIDFYSGVDDKLRTACNGFYRDRGYEIRHFNLTGMT